MVRRRKTGGLAIPVTFLFIFVLLTLTLALLLSGQTTADLSQAIEGRLSEKDVADAVFARFQRIFSSGGSPDPADLAAVGLAQMPPEPGGPRVEFGGEMEGIAFYGVFNGGEPPYSVYNPPCAPIDPDRFGFLYSNEPPTNDLNKIVPPWHSLVFVHVQAPEQPPRTFFTLYSSLNPDCALAPGGSITVREVLASLLPVPPSPQAQAAGRPFRLVAGRTIQVQGSMNGRALSALPRDQHPIQVGEGSIGEILEGIADLEVYQAYVEEMMGQLERVMGELEKKGEDPGFLALGIAIFAAQQVQSIGGWTGLPVSTGGFGFDPGEKALTWNGSMYVPDKMPMLIPCNLVIRGHLLVGPGALVLVNGRLKIEGRLILKKDSLVLVKKDLEVQDRVNVAYAAGQEMAIRSFLMAEGDIHLGRGVRHLKKDYSGGSVKFPFAGNANPFEKMIKQKKGKDWIWVVNPAWVTFNQIQSQLLGQLLSACNPLQRFLMATLAIPLGDEDSQTPGLLIASEKGGVYIHDHEPGAVAAGMILTREGIVLEFPPDGSGIFTGVLMTSSGDIQAFTTQLRYYPYYAVAPVLEAGQLCVPVAYPLVSGVADTPGRRP